jgi:hypothetical protein
MRPNSAPSATVATIATSVGHLATLISARALKIGQCEGGANAESDAAGKHDNRHADDHQSKFTYLPRRVREISNREEIRNGLCHKDGKSNEKEDGDRIVRPSSVEHFANEVVRHIARAQSGGQVGNHRDLYPQRQKKRRAVFRGSALHRSGRLLVLEILGAPAHARMESVLRDLGRGSVDHDLLLAGRLAGFQDRRDHVGEVFTPD